MVYGDAYKSTLKIPTINQHKLIERSAPHLCNQAKRRVEKAQKITLSLCLLPLFGWVLGIVNDFIMAFIWLLPAVIGIFFIASALDHYKIVKRHTAQMCAGKYLVAVGRVDHYEVKKDKCLARGRLGSKSHPTIEFEIDKKFIEDSDATQEDFLCVIIQQSAYVISRIASGAIVATNRVDVYSVNSHEMREVQWQ
jgi:hypothetical protein